MSKHLDKLSVQFKCHRTLISGRNERTLVQQAIRSHEEKQNSPKAHALYRSGPLHRNQLWVVSSRSSGVPFAEAVLEKVTERPLLAVSSEIQKNGEQLWLVRVDRERDGTDKIEEISFPMDSTLIYREPLASFIRKVIKDEGRAVFINEALNFDGKNGFSHIAIDGEFETPFFISNDDDLQKAKEAAGILYEVDRVSIDFNKSKIVTQETKRLPIPKSKLQIITLVAICLVFVWGFQSLLNQKEIEQKIQATETKKQELIDRFSNGLAPKYALYQIYKMLIGDADSRNKYGLLESVSGWSVKSVELKPESIIVRMKGDRSSSVDEVRNSAAILRAGSLAISQDEVAIVKEFDSDCRMPILSQPVKMPIEGVSNYLLNAFRMYSPDTQIEFGSEEKKEGYSVRSMTLSVNQISPESIDSIGTLLNFLPIDFKSANLSSSGENNLLDGQISLEIIGCTISEIDENGLCKS